MAWNLEREDLIDSLSRFAAFKFEINDVLDIFTDMGNVGISFVASDQLELEVFDVLAALGVVSDDAHFGHLSKIVLVLFEEDLRGGGSAFGEA